MNKKLSLMLAAFLAAGFSVTAEAGIVKVTSVKSGQKYLIAAEDFTGAADQKIFTTDKAMAVYAADGQNQEWTATATGFEGLTSDDANGALSGGSQAAVEIDTYNPIVAKNLTNKYLKLDEAVCVFSSTESDGNAYVFAVTVPISASEASYFKVGEKYLVLVPATELKATGNATTKLVAAEELAQAGDLAKWTVSEVGKVISVADPTLAIIGYDADADFFTVGAVANAVEVSTFDNQLFVGNVVVDGISATDVQPGAPTPAVTPVDAVRLVKNGLYLLKVNIEGGYISQEDQKAAELVAEEGKSTYWTAKEVETNVYQFVNKDNIALRIGDISKFTVEKNATDNGFRLKAENNKYVQYAGSKFDWADEGSIFGAIAIEPVSLTVADLNYYEKDGFSLSLTYGDKKSLAGNPFVGHLTPMKKASTNKFEAAEDNAVGFYLKNSAGKYIVAYKDVDGNNDNYYKFKTVEAKELLHDLANDGEYLAYFSAACLKSDDKKDLETLVSLTVSQSSTGNSYEIGYVNISNVATLAASSDFTGVYPINIKLGGDDIVAPKDLLVQGKFYTVVRKASANNTNPTGKMGVDLSDGNDTPNAYGEVAFGKTISNVLEGQWALTISEDGENYVFTNRENTGVTFEDIEVAKLYKTKDAHVYRFGGDTYEIKTVAEHAATDGYETLSDLKNTKFHIGYFSHTYDAPAWFVENHRDGKNKNHVLGLNIDKDAALTFTAVEFAAPYTVKEDESTHKDEYTASDSIYVISKLGYIKANGDYAETLDTLKVVSYAFINQYNEPLILGEDADKNEAYVSLATTKYNTLEAAIEAVTSVGGDGQKFTLRQDAGKLNLRPVSWERAEASVIELDENYQTFNLGEDYNKVYSGDASIGILANTKLYSRVENDLFVVEPTDKPMYRPVINALDTISIFRNDNHKSVLFENNRFLGMENLDQYPNIASGMIADTAYVRYDTYRPQYMLVVGAKKHGATTWCPDHGYGATCQHAQKINGYMEGRYLVNLKDTAIAWDKANKHNYNNPYINSENHYKLGFVQATHRNDSLIIAGDNKRIFMGDENYNVAKFAFRYVDTEEKSFVIETADYKRLPEGDDAGKLNDNYGYLKWMNGVVVVVDRIQDADIFNMDEEFKGDPTANESISASAVTVIAGEGQVTIAGAAGKKVVISNILGQVVANTVIASDNATIAAPAGVVVVAVEGEAAVKAIVK